MAKSWSAAAVVLGSFALVAGMISPAVTGTVGHHLSNDTGGGQSGSVTFSESTDVLAAPSPTGGPTIVGLQDGIWSMSADGGTLHRLTKPASDFVRPAYSPDGKRIVVQQYVGSQFQLVTMDPDGSQRKQVTHGHYDSREPVWSPDGSKIAFSSDRDGNYDIWVLDVQTGEVTQWTDGPQSQYSPTWSPDGKHIAYVVGVESDAHTIQASTKMGQPHTVISRPNARLRSPSWSPDGGQIAFTSEKHGANHLFVASTGSDQPVAGKQVSAKGEDVFGFRPRWTDDHTVMYSSNGHIQRRNLSSGQKETVPFEATISFDRNSYEFKRHDFGYHGPKEVKGIVSPTVSSDTGAVAFVALNDLWLKNPGQQPQRLTKDEFKELNPDFSSSGRYLAYSSDRSGTEKIYIRDMRTGQEHPLTDFTSPEYAADNQYRAVWSPDGSKIAWQQGRGFETPPITYVTEVSTGKTREVSALSRQFEPGKPTWGPNGDRLAFAAIKSSSKRFRQGYNYIRVANLDTGSAYWVKPGGQKFHNINMRDQGNGPVWSPDGKYMAYSRNGLLYVMPVDSTGHPAGKAHPITQHNADYIDWVDTDTLSYVSNGKLETISVEGTDRNRIPLHLKWSPAVPQGVTVIHAGAIWDGNSHHLQRDVYIVVVGTKIRAVIPAHGQGPKHLKAPDMKGMHAQSMAQLMHGNKVHVVDATDETVIPGLIEGHMHREWIPYTGAREGRQLLAYGITTTISLGDPGYRSMETKESVASGARVGARAFTAAAHINGSQIYYGFMRVTPNEATLRRELNRIKALGVDAVKTYVRLPYSMQKKAIQAAHDMGLPTFSHYFYPALAFGQDDMSHLSATQRWGFSHTMSAGGHTYADVIKLAKKSGMAITNTPFGASTLLRGHPGVVRDQRIQTLYAPWQKHDLQEAYQNATTTDQSDIRSKLKKQNHTFARLVNHGAQVWAGTDEPLVHVGQSLQETLRVEVRFGGMTPYQALETATTMPAKSFGVADQLGAIEKGYVADLVFVKGNPLKNISATGNVQAVMRGGHYHTVQQLLAPYQK